MNSRIEKGRGVVALVVAVCVALPPAAPLLAEPQAAGAPGGPAGPPATLAPASARAASSPAEGTVPAPADGGWPRAYETPSGGRILVYQPQIANWDEQKHMSAYAAVSYEANGATKPALGSVRVEADTAVAVDARLVSFRPLQITESSFPTLDRDAVREVVAEIAKSIPDEERVISLDRVMAGLDRSAILPKNVEGVRADPPVVLYSTRNAVLVNLDGDPIWSPIAGNDLKFAVNTNWDLFQHGPTGTLYLRSERSWLQAPKLDGPWAPAAKLPDSFGTLPADDNWKDVKAAVPAKPLAAKDAPAVFTSTKPAELILAKGGPAYRPVAGTKLLWVSNAEADVFRMGEKGSVYFLVSGRWFSAPGFEGPWTFATPSLPDDFRRIPLEHPRSRALASVPGTQQAAEAVLLAQVPQTAKVNRRELKAPEVAYQGEPKFEPIEKTSVARAVNTDKDVLKVGDLYYMCFQGVWFASRAPQGPWEVARSVPKAIYDIPVSSPAHNVTYVTVVDDGRDDEWVTFATVAAYTGVMVAWGCAVWGTGFYYPPYWGWGGMYPWYYPHYPTYGYGAWYNPWTGAYGRTAVAYGPYGGAGFGARYNPTTGTYSRGAAAWGPYGATGFAQAYNPRTGAYGQTRQGSNVYGSWGASSVQRGDQWAQTARVTNRATGSTTRVTRGSEGGGAVTRRGPEGGGGAVRTPGGDVYAGRDGNVYRKQGESWQKYGDGGWNEVSRDGSRTAGARDRAAGAGAGAAGTFDQLNRDSRARAEGQQRTRDYGSWQGGRSSGASYRGAGGARAAGGGARGGRRR